MKTKKDILNWYISLGPKEQGDDWKDFFNKIEEENLKEPLIINSLKNLKGFSIFIFPKRCKTPVRLYFYKNECYRIVY